MTDLAKRFTDAKDKLDQAFDAYAKAQSDLIKAQQAYQSVSSEYVRAFFKDEPRASEAGQRMRSVEITEDANV